MKKNLLATLVSTTLLLENLFSTNLMASPINNVLNATTTSTTANLLDDTENTTFSWDNTTVYFVLTDRFLNGNTSNDTSYGRTKTDSWGKNIGTFHGGDIAGLTKKLNEGYFEDLGVNTIWLTAPYEQAHGFAGGGNNGDFAHYAYHGYYPLDYTMMDKNMGTIEEMRTFVDTAHEKGIRVVLDVVLNHTGYLTLQDMADYNINPTSLSASQLASWRPNKNNGETWHSYHNLVDYQGHMSEWAKWWSPGWIRAGVPGYTPGGSSDITLSLSGLPDVKTEVTSNQGLAPILKTKWSKETSGYDKWILPSAKDLRKDLGISPSDYQIKWLAAWVKEFGIDGFRADTAKHVDMFRWAQLKDACNTALKEWRQNNPNKPGADWDEDFWTTAEVFGHGANKSNYHTDGKFDSVINFNFPKDGNISAIDSTYQSYANGINSSNDWNILSYISSHDTVLSRSNMINLGSTLLLSPGGVQIFYGDETNRSFGETGSDKDQGTRSDMNWNNLDKATLTHWQKVGQFRNNHISVGAGTHTKLNNAPYTFQRHYDKNGIQDDVIVVLGASGTQTINVSSAFADGSVIRDAYTGTQATVQNGKVTITPHSNGVILLELASKSLRPTISVTPGTVSKVTKYYSESLNINIALGNATKGSYKINDGDWVTFENTATITLDKTLPLETTTNITVKTSNDLGTAEETYSYLKTVSKPATVHFYKPANWGTPYVYYYTADTSVTTPAWPGTAMTDEGNNWYSFTTPDIEEAYFIFNDKVNQTPGPKDDGYQISGEKWVKNSKIYNKIPEVTVPTVAEGELKLFIYKPEGWGTNLNAYVYNDSTSTTDVLAAWPGKAMTDEGEDLYSIELDNNWLNSKVIFNDGSKQYPAKTGLTVDASRCYVEGAWELCKVKADNTLAVSISPENTTFSTDTLTLTLGAKNTTSATYSIDGGAETPYTDGEQIEIGKDVESGDITVTLTATNGTEPISKTYTYTKEVVNTTTLKAYFDNSNFNWSNLHAYVYNEDASGVQTISAWPGVAMTSEGNNIYSYTLPESWKNARVIFNNGGSSQYPASGQPGLVLDQTNSNMIYQNGAWTAYTGNINPIIEKKIYFNNSSYNWPNVKAYIYDASTGTILQNADWPGLDMTNEGNNLYSYTFTEDWNAPKVIFTNGSTQIPASGQQGFDLNHNMILDSDVWTTYSK